jgi:hypothetical protein
MPDIYVEAEYDDGYVHREDDVDASPYVEGRNIFDDILHRRPEDQHGKTVRFSLVVPDGRHDVFFDALPDNARPIRWKHMQTRITVEGESGPIMTGIDFGYQYTDDNGENVQHVIAIR